MNFTKTKFLIPISFLLFLTCQYISELKHIDEIVSEAYVNNPNGLALYKTKGDLNSKEVVLNPKEMFYFLEYEELEKEGNWRKVLYKTKTYFLYNYSYYNDFMEYYKVDIKKSRFAVLEEDAKLEETPHIDNNGKELELLSAFSVVEILKVNLKNRTLPMVKVKTKKGNIGFLESELSTYDTKEIAEKYANSETIQSHGYFLVASKEPIFLDIKSMTPIDRTKHKKILGKDNLLYVNHSKKIDGVRYYFNKMRNRNDVMIEHYGNHDYLIPESNGKFLAPKDFTEYTIQNTRYTGNKELLQQINKSEKSWFNFLDFTLTKLTNNSSEGNYYLANVKNADLHERDFYFLCKYNGEQYSRMELNNNFHLISGFKTFDLDGDGVLEFLIEETGRSEYYNELFGMIKGKYEAIAYFSTDTLIKNNTIYVKSIFKESKSLKDGYAYSNTKSHPKGTKLKYQKGKLIKIK